MLMSGAKRLPLVFLTQKQSSGVAVAEGMGWQQTRRIFVGLQLQ